MNIPKLLRQHWLLIPKRVENKKVVKLRIPKQINQISSVETVRRRDIPMKTAGLKVEENKAKDLNKRKRISLKQQ